MTYMPIDGRPFAVSMGLRAMNIVDWIEVDSHFDSELNQKRNLLQQQRTQVFGALDRGLAGSAEALAMLTKYLPERFPGLYPATIEVDPDMHPLEAASLLVQEDLVIMSPGEGDQAGHWILTAACVCFPSRWDLTQKVGLDMHGIHEPVPHYEERIGAATDAMFSKFTPDRPVWRINWTVLDDDELFQPTGESRYGKTSADTAAHGEPDFGNRMFFRTERQTLTAMPETGDVLFTIRTYVSSLNETVRRHPEFKEHLGATLASTSPDTRIYKGWEPIWGDLMAWTGQQD